MAESRLPASRAFTVDDLLHELGVITSRADARALVGRALRVSGVKRRDALETGDLLLILEALGSEGGPVQEIAEMLARRALT